MALSKRLFNGFTRIKKGLASRFSSLNKRRRVFARRAYIFTQNRPFSALFIVLALFLMLMILGNVFFSPKPAPTQNTSAPKSVKVFRVGIAPEISYQGKIEKSGVVKIVAQTPGIVSSINVSEGQEVGQGTNILSLASNYSGGNAASVARQIAGEQYQTAKDTYDTQKDIIGKQRELADKNKDNLDLMRSIATSSASDTQNLIGLEQDIVNSWQTVVDNESDPSLKLQDQGFLAQYKGALLQLQASNNSLTTQSNDTSGDLASLNHDIAIKQLDLQEKNLQMALDISGLQYRMAQINEANMFPSSPFSGTVDKIFVHVGDSVNPGTPLAEISGDSQHAEVVVSVPADIARNVSNLYPSTLTFGKETLNRFPTFVSLDATNGTLYSVIYDLGDPEIPNLTDSAYIEVKIPIGTPDTTNIDPYVPLDAVVQTQEEAFVFTIDGKNIARAKKVTLGQIQGKYVEILSGLPKNAEIILDRNVIDGDKVSASR